MATANAVRRRQIKQVVEAAQRMLGLQKAAKEVSEEIAKRKEKEEAG